MTQPMPRTCVVTCMRNEGQFLLEWVAYYRALGFDEIIVLTNDCDDGTDAMLDRLDSIGDVTHIVNTCEAGESPQVAGMRRALKHPKVRGCDWMLHVDADEFLRIDHGAGQIQDLLAAMPEHTDLIALAWLPFGNDGQIEWTGGNVLELNTRCQDEFDNGGFHKSLFRPNKFARAIDHMPKQPFGPVVARNGMGRRMNDRPTKGDRSKFREDDTTLLTWEGACVHHYAIRSEDVFVMKNARGDGMALNNSKYFLNSGFYKRFNRNDRVETSIHRHLSEMKRIKKLYLEDDKLCALHTASETWFQNLKQRVLTDEQRAKWTRN